LKLLKNFFLFLVGTGWKFEPGLGDSLGKIFANRRPPLSVKRNIISFSFFCEKITFFFIQKGAHFSRAGSGQKKLPPACHRARPRQPRDFRSPHAPRSASRAGHPKRHRVQTGGAAAHCARKRVLKPKPHSPEFKKRRISRAKARPECPQTRI
jgi:hypothetical protein